MRALLLVGLLALTTACGGVRHLGPPVQLEIRPGSFEPGEGLTAVTVEGPDQKVVYLSDEVLLGNEHIASARSETGPHGPEISLRFTEDGTRLFAEATERFQGRPLGIVVDGHLICAPTVREKVPQGRAVIQGRFAEAEARRIVDGLVR